MTNKTQERFAVEIVDSEGYIEEMKKFLDAARAGCSLQYSNSYDQLRRSLRSGAVKDLYLISETAFSMKDLEGPTRASEYIRLGAERDRKNPLILTMDENLYEAADPDLRERFGKFEGGITRGTYISEPSKEGFYSQLAAFLNDSELQQISRKPSRTRQDIEGLAKKFNFLTPFESRAERPAKALNNYRHLNV